MTADRRIGGMKPAIWAILLAEYVGIAVVLFWTAGTVDWPAGWVFVILFVLCVTPMSVGLARHDPALIEERMKILPQKEQPIWDRVLMVLLIVLIGLWLALPGLDVVRNGWSVMPVWLQAVGGVGVVLSLWANFAVMRQNTFLAPTVRIQEERGHKVITTGAYGIVRHPFYATLGPFFLAAALLLGSWTAALVSVVIMVVFGWRAVREEAHLKGNLQGYADYMQKVRNRLVPGVW